MAIACTSEIVEGSISPSFVKQMDSCAVSFITIAIEHAIAILCVTISRLHLKGYQIT